MKIVSQTYAAICNPLIEETCEPSGAATVTGPDLIGLFLAKLITVILSIGGIALLFMILWAALEWIIAGGDTEKIKAAQKRLFSAIIGFGLVASAAIIFDLVGSFLGLEFLRTLDVPWPIL